MKNIRIMSIHDTVANLLKGISYNDKENGLVFVLRRRCPCLTCGWVGHPLDLDGTWDEMIRCTVGFICKQRVLFLRRMFWVFVCDAAPVNGSSIGFKWDVG